MEKAKQTVQSDVGQAAWIDCREFMPPNAAHPGAICPRYLVSTIFGVTEGWYNPDYDLWYILVWRMTRNGIIDMNHGDIPMVCSVPRSAVYGWMQMPTNIEYDCTNQRNAVTMSPDDIRGARL